MNLLPYHRSAKFKRKGRLMQLHWWVELVLVASILTGCSAPQAAPSTASATPTLTPVPTSTVNTSVPPTSASVPAFTLATSISDIVGIWQSPGKSLLFHFFEDGTLHQAHSLNSLDTDPYAISKVWFEGTQMFNKEVAVSGVPSCGDEPAIYEVHLLPDGYIQIVKIQDKCSPRAGDTALKLEPVR